MPEIILFVAFVAIVVRLYREREQRRIRRINGSRLDIRMADYYKKLWAFDKWKKKHEGFVRYVIRKEVSGK